MKKRVVAGSSSRSPPKKKNARKARKASRDETPKKVALPACQILASTGEAKQAVIGAKWGRTESLE